ncbi:transcriptional regulator, AraC family protein [Verrucomicrobiia bacterium DG1235]|nr:transcriptional regulator, AraC family protein [Verrucomicrobiae bacterium DG1235]
MEAWTIAQPSERWTSSVEYFWLVEESASGVFEVVPDGRFDFGISLSRGSPRFILYGVATKRRQLIMEKGTRYAGARLRPGVALSRGLVDRRPLCDEEVEREEFGGIAAREIRNMFEEGAEVSVVEGILSPILEKVVGIDDADSRWVRRATDSIIASKGSGRIDALATELGVSRRFLELVFKRTLGISPKRFAQITRLGAVANLIRDREADWAGLAAEFEFSDQAHMSRDVSRMTGYTPRHFKERVREMPEGWAGTVEED